MTLHGHGSLLKAYGTFVVAKALAMGIVATLLDIEFWRALILVIVSAVITGWFGWQIAREQQSDSQRTRDRLDRLEQRGQDIASAVGADNPDADVPPKE